MATPAEDEITQILCDLSATDHDEMAALLPVVYKELRELSASYLRNERPDHTLQATALVHEAYLHLMDQKEVRWQNRDHFFRLAAVTMRRILINHAVRHRALKRGGGLHRVSLTDAEPALDQEPIDIIALDEALTQLASISEQKARIVELRYFAGCTIEETAETLGISTASVERDWRFARAWLWTRLADPPDAEGESNTLDP